GRDAAPYAAKPVQRPDAEHVVDSEPPLAPFEHDDKKRSGDAARHQRAERMHDVRARADRDEARKCAVVNKARIVPPNEKRGQNSTGHGHEGVERHKARNGGERSGGHDVEAEPADAEEPGTERQPGNGGGRKADKAAIRRVAAAAMSEEENRAERDPSTNCMNDDGAGEIVETGAESCGEPVLQSQIAVPDEALEKGIGEADDRGRGCRLGEELRAFGDAARNNCRYGGGESQQEEEFNQIAALRRKR